MRYFTLLAGMALSAVLASSSVYAQGEAGPVHLRAQGHFYVGIRTEEVEGNPNVPGPFGAGGTAIHGQMFVGYQLPVERTQPYPLILVHGGGGQALDYKSTPDGRAGWVDYFLNAGFDVYYVDRPAHGRSPNNQSYGELGNPANSSLMAFLANGERWPGDMTAEDPALLQLLASSEPGPTVDAQMLKENFAELLDRVGPAIVVTHSAGGPSGWLSIDARPDQVRALVAIEAVAGFENLPLTWAPPLPAGEQLPMLAGEDGACAMQPPGQARELANFAGIPILGVLAPESFFAANYHCTIEFINQAGGNAALIRLEDVGILGNGHMMMMDENSHEVVQVLINWMSQID